MEENGRFREEKEGGKADCEAEGFFARKRLSESV